MISYDRKDRAPLRSSVQGPPYQTKGSTLNEPKSPTRWPKVGGANVRKSVGASGRKLADGTPSAKRVAESLDLEEDEVESSDKYGVQESQKRTKALGSYDRATDRRQPSRKVTTESKFNKDLEKSLGMSPKRKFDSIGGKNLQDPLQKKRTSILQSPDTPSQAAEDIEVQQVNRQSGDRSLKKPKQSKDKTAPRTVETTL